MDHPILNIADLEYFTMNHGDRFDGRIGYIGAKLGAKQLGYNLTVLSPGKSAFPFHNHRVNEEMFFVLEGEGEVRIGANRYPIRQGDAIACPAGGPETAHQIINTSQTTELKFLAVSTRMSPEVSEYPDSGKFGVMTSFPEDTDGQTIPLRFVGRETEGLDYWDGE